MLFFFFEIQPNESRNLCGRPYFNRTHLASNQSASLSKLVLQDLDLVCGHYSIFDIWISSATGTIPLRIHNAGMHRGRSRPAGCRRPALTITADPRAGSQGKPPPSRPALPKGSREQARPRGKGRRSLPPAGRRLPTSYARREGVRERRP